MVHGRARAPPRQTWRVALDEGRLEVSLRWEAFCKGLERSTQRFIMNFRQDSDGGRKHRTNVYVACSGGVVVVDYLVNRPTAVL